ncbi:MAG: hypothetical protein ACFFFT_00830 [Candidatus Thorarchaeota archaeon]
MANIHALQESFACKYRHCSKCGVELDISKDKELVCALCGETFCSDCIYLHQKSCFGI